MEKEKDKKPVISIAYFDILGFKKMVETKKDQEILDLINQLRGYISQKSGSGGFPTPMPPDGSWRNGCTQFVWAIFPLDIEFDYQSDTFIMWANIGNPNSKNGKPHPSALHVFLDAVQWFFCKALQNGIPLRGAIATGDAYMDKEKKVYFGTAFNEAAEAESAQDSIGIAYATNKYPPLLTGYTIPYKKHIKEKRENLVTKRVVNWCNFWDDNKDFSSDDVIEKIRSMRNENFPKYYDNAIDFVNFSRAHKQWWLEIDESDIRSNEELDKRTDAWLDSLEQ